jgi:lysophospholipase L1-like esterase
MCGVQDSSQLRFLALGDSYTIGEAVDPADRWPAQLARALHRNGVEVAPPEIVARTGWTTDELSAAIDAASLSPPYDLVSLLIGVNNQYRGRAVDEYREEFRALLDRAVTFAGGEASRVIVVSIPDWGVTEFARQKGSDRARVAAEIDAYNRVNREESGRVSAHYVDITAGSRLAERDPKLIAADGLHPSARMYEEWTAAILPAALAVLAVSGER